MSGEVLGKPCWKYEQGQTDLLSKAFLSSCIQDKTYKDITVQILLPLHTLPSVASSVIVTIVYVTCHSSTPTGLFISRKLVYSCLGAFAWTLPAIWNGPCPPLTSPCYLEWDRTPCPPLTAPFSVPSTGPGDQ